MQRGFTRGLDVLLVSCAIASTVALVANRRGPQRAGSGEFRSFAGWQEDLNFDRRLGGASAPYRLVVWTDYQCPACRRFENEVDRLRAQLGDSLAVVYRFLPLDVHSLAFPAAIAAECARDQGRFEAMHRVLFAAHLTGDSLPVGSIMAAIGDLDTARFKTCLSDSAARGVVLKDMLRAKALELRGTPSLQVGDRIGTGGRMAEELLPLLRAAHR